MIYVDHLSTAQGPTATSPLTPACVPATDRPPTDKLEVVRLPTLKRAGHAPTELRAPRGSPGRPRRPSRRSPFARGSPGPRSTQRAVPVHTWLLIFQGRGDLRSTSGGPRKSFSRTRQYGSSMVTDLLGKVFSLPVRPTSASLLYVPSRRRGGSMGIAGGAHARRGGRCLAATLVATSLSMFSAPHSLALNWGSSARVEFSPNQYNAVSVNADYIVPVFFESSLPTIIRTAFGWSFTNNYGTNLDMFQTTTSSWDVTARELNYGSTGVVGWVDCPPTAFQGGSHPSHHCADQILRLNDVYDFQYDTTNEARSVVCHELGHTVGLRHSNDVDSPGSCMFRVGPDPTRIGLTPHDYEYLFSRYGVHV